MSDMVLTRTRIQGGVYEGVLSGGGEDPKLVATCAGEPAGPVTVSHDPEIAGAYSVRFEIPADFLTDGVQTVLLSDPETGARLDGFSILTGQPIDEDLRGEIALLRAELDMLKKAFRRHCNETKGY
ncbi:MAG: hypothetical protein AAF700_04410 [Pseudomonadota bacterium]